MPDGTTPVTIAKPHKEAEVLSLEQIMRKESAYLGQDNPANKAVFDEYLVEHVSRRLVVAASAWQEVGKALSYMVRNEIPQRLGYGSIEKWVQESLRPNLLDYKDGDKGVAAILQWRNYWDALEFISEVSDSAAQNLIEARAGVAEFRNILSWASKPQTRLPGVRIEPSEELKEELLEVTARAIAHIGVEEPDPDDFPPNRLPPGKSFCDVAQTCRASALNKMREARTKEIAKRFAQEVDDRVILVNHYYEMLGSYEYFRPEQTTDPDTGVVTEEKLKKVKFDFKGENEETRWVEVMKYDPEEREVFIRPWRYFSIEKEDRSKYDMDEDGTLKKSVSICMLNLKDESRVALTKEDLDYQPATLNLSLELSHKHIEALKKKYRNKEQELMDKMAQFAEEIAEEAIKQKDELSAKKNAEAAQAIA
jgi:hypothetical protein